MAREVPSGERFAPPQWSSRESNTPIEPCHPSRPAALGPPHLRQSPCGALRLRAEGFRRRAGGERALGSIPSLMGAVRRRSSCAPTLTLSLTDLPHCTARARTQMHSSHK